MLRDLREAWGWIQKLIRRVERVESGAMLENSSITNGRMRFIGGLLRIDSGGTLSIEGTLLVDGVTTVTGQFTVEGPWGLTGNGTITGNVTVTGTWTWQGDLNLTGDINVTGAGRIKVGSSMTLNPAGSNGRIEFANGAQVFTDGSTIQMYKGNSVVQVSDTYARIQYGGSIVSVGSDGLKMSVNETRTTTETALPAGVLGIDGQTVFRVVPG